MDTEIRFILTVMGVLLLVLFGVAWIAVRSARADRERRRAQGYSRRRGRPK